MIDMKKLYSALANDTALTSLLHSGVLSIYKQNSPEAGKLPLLVYSMINNLPILHADNVEIADSTSIRIHIVTADGDYYQIQTEVLRIMTGLGFMRVNTTETYISGEKLLILDFRGDEI